MILLPTPWYQPLVKRGDWRLSMRSRVRANHWIAWRVERLPEGNVYLLFLPWLLAKVMVKA